MKTIVDTDILSMFAKVGAINALVDLFGSSSLAMTPATRDEISIPLQYGYHYPSGILQAISVVVISEQVLQEFYQLLSTKNLGKGEVQAIALCKIEGGIFATNDRRAQIAAHAEGVEVITLPVIVRQLWQSGLHSKETVKVLWEQIKTADKLQVSSEVEQRMFGDNE